MATNYTGNQGSTQAPSGPPAPDANPIVSLAADGDPLNAASIAQGFKVAMDWLAWLTKPRAIASQWAQAIRIFRSAAGHQRFGVDHLGFPAGRITHWRENWQLTEGATASGGVPVTAVSVATGWTYKSLALAGGSGLAIGGASPGTAAGFLPWRRLQLSTADSAGDYSYAVKGPQGLFGADACFSMEWDFVSDTLNSREITMGFNNTLSPTGTGPIAQFYNLGGSGNWRCHTNDGTALTDTDSGVAITASRTRFRVEYHGVNVDDAGVERVLFFIDGVLRATNTTNLPSVPALPSCTPFFYQGNASGTGSPRTMSISPITFSANLFRDAF